MGRLPESVADMTVIRKQASGKWKFMLLMVMVVSLSAVAWAFVRYLYVDRRPDRTASVVREGESVSIGTVRQTSIKNGIKEWQLAADSVDYALADNQAVFKGLTVTFFLKDGRKVVLTADRGVLHTRSNDIEISGDILAVSSDYTLTAETAYYDHDLRRLTSDADVRVSGQGFDLAANGVSFDLNSGKTVFSGNVSGSFDDDVSL